MAPDEKSRYARNIVGRGNLFLLVDIDLGEGNAALSREPLRLRFEDWLDLFAWTAPCSVNYALVSCELVREEPGASDGDKPSLNLTVSYHDSVVASDLLQVLR